MESRKLGFRQIACVTIVSAVVGGITGLAGGVLGKNIMERFSGRCAPLTDRLPRCPEPVTSLLSLDELKTMTQEDVRRGARKIREDLDVDGNAKVTLVFSIDVERSGDTNLRSVSAMCEGEECERRSGSALLTAEGIFRGEQIEQPPGACTLSFEVEVPPVNSCQ